MAIRFRKSIKIAPGVKVNLNKKSAGITVGGKGVHYTVNTSGTRTASAGIPGTGLYVTDVSNGKAKKKKQPAASSNTVKHTAPVKAAAVSETVQSKETKANGKAPLIILRIIFAIVAIAGSFIFTYGAEIIGGIIFAVGAFLFWVALKMKPEDLNDDRKEEDVNEES